MSDSEPRKGFLLGTDSNTMGALRDPRSSQKMSFNGWSSNYDSSNGAWRSGSGAEGNKGWGSSGNGNGGWDKYLDNKELSGWGVPLTNKLNGGELIIEDIENERRDYDMSSILENRPFLPRNLGVPKNVLSVWYGKRHKDITFTVNSCFTTWHDEGPAHMRYFTSVFSCPVTGEMFSCGRHGDETTYKVDNEEVPEGETEMISVVWYRKKSLAEHSAAARALDCLSFREGDGIPSMSYGLCIDEPYIIAADAPPLSKSAPKDLCYQLVDEIQSCDTEDCTQNILIVEEERRSEFESVYGSVIGKKETPKGALIKWYERVHKEISFSPSCFITWHDKGLSHERRYTTVFKCPLTGEIFSCGQYGKVENYLVKEEELSSETMGDNAEEGNSSVVWYRKRIMAEHAAAARALDCLYLRELRVSHTSAIRLCIEDSYLSPDDAPLLPSSAPAELYALQS